MSNEFTRSDLRQTLDLDLQADAGERLMHQLTAADAALARRIEPAIRLAGQQLELMKPCLAVIGARGVIFESVANVEIGSFVFLFADARRVVTSTCALAAGCSAGQALEEMVAEAEAIGPPEDGWVEGSVGTMLGLLDRAGVKPGGISALGDAAVPLIGAMLAALSPETRSRLGHAIDVCRETAFCPAVVCLIGPASSGRAGFHSLVWPLTMPLARYAEYVMRRAEEAPPDA